MDFPLKPTDLVRRRYSCRAYEPQAMAPDLQRELAAFLAGAEAGPSAVSVGAGVPARAHAAPLGTRCRFSLVAATEDDRKALKGLGTYGFVKDAPGFILGAAEAGPKALEDFGYLLERAILYATGLGLGTCWLGGTFSKSRFAGKISLRPGELMPAVASIGYPAPGSREGGRIRRYAGADSRLPASVLFFDGGFDRPISREAAGPLAGALEAVRWAPSASNRQPWRVVRDGAGWHFYLERTKGYGKGTLLFRMLRLADLQRVDIGIAMCHFELVAHELGLAGSWVVEEPSVAAGGREYAATFVAG